MRAVERQVNEERLIRGGVDKINCRTREHIAAIAGKANGLAVLEQDRIMEWLPPGRSEAWPMPPPLSTSSSWKPRSMGRRGRLSPRCHLPKIPVR